MNKTKSFYHAKRNLKLFFTSSKNTKFVLFSNVILIITKITSMIMAGYEFIELFDYTSKIYYKTV